MTVVNGATRDITSASPRQRDEGNFSNNFLVKIISSQHGSVIARAPEELALQLSSEWDSALGGGGSNSGLGILAAEGAGLSTRNEFSSAQVWSGNSPIEITIPLEFYAEESSQEEVVNPIIKLVKMALPRKGGTTNIPGVGEVGLFVPPGPRIFNTGGSANDQITIQLGKFVTFRKVIMIEANPVFVTKEMHSSGFPLRATCEIRFRTIFSLTGDDFQGMFSV